MISKDLGNLLGIINEAIMASGRFFREKRDCEQILIITIYLKDDTSNTRSYSENKVSDPSNAPYQFLTFGEISSLMNF